MYKRQYRSGEKLTNEWDGMTHDYTRKGGVVHTEIMLPPHAPPSFSDRSTLWNSVELYEKAGNADVYKRQGVLRLLVSLFIGSPFHEKSPMRSYICLLYTSRCV